LTLGFELLPRWLANGLGWLWALGCVGGWVSWFGFESDWFWTGLSFSWLALASWLLPSWLFAGLALWLDLDCIGFSLHWLFAGLFHYFGPGWLWALDFYQDGFGLGWF